MSYHENDLEFVNIEKSYLGKPVLKGISLAVRKGEFIAILGPSGSGKSTLLKIAAGFERQERGAVFIRGEDVSRKLPYQRNVNTVFQSYALFPHLTAIDNVAYGLRRKKVPEAEVRERVSRALDMVGLASFGDRLPEMMSGGQQQRVALARAIVNRPAVLLLDEPLSALDLKIRQRMQMELKRIHQETGTTFMFVTHDQEEAIVMADRIVVMHDGAIEQVGTPREVYDRPATAYVANFVGEINWLTVRQSSGGRAVLGDGSEIRLPAHGVTAGVPRIGVRPEQIQLDEGDHAPDQGNSVKARVTNVSFKGSSQRVDLELPDGTSLHCSIGVLPGFAQKQIVVGQSVRCRWDVASTLVFPSSN